MPKRTDTYNVGVLYPHLVDEYDDKRNDKTIFEYTPGSKEIVYWICKEHGSYKADYYHRTKRGSGCPKCGYKHAWETKRKNIGSASFANIHPELIEDIHPNKNEDFDPHKVTSGSHRKIWWQCYRNHEWEATIKDRVRGTNCPYCFSSKTSKPELLILSEITALFPDAEHRGKVDKIECDVFIETINLGIEYDGAYYHRGKEKKDKLKIKKLKKLGIALIRVRQEPLRKLSPIDVIYKKIDSDAMLMVKIFEKIKCNKDLNIKQHKWIDKYINNCELLNQEYFNELRTRLPRPPKIKTLQYLHPEIAIEWDYDKNSPLTPEDVSPHSNEIFWWICSNNHSYESPVDSRHKHGCGYCSGRHATEENNLQKLYPEIIKELHPTKNGEVDCTKITPKSSQELYWLCEKNHTYSMDISHKTRGQGCPYCAGQRVGDDNNLVVLYNEIAEQLHPTRNGSLDASTLNPYSKKKYWFICDKGHEYKQGLEKKTKLGQKCPYCSGRYPTKERNLLALFPKIANEWHPTLNNDTNPEDYLPSSNGKAWWLCPNGHSYERHIGVRTRKPSTLCPICKKNKI